MPLEATQHTSEGARAFAEFFIKTIDWGYATTSSTYMRHYFTKSCIECLSAANAIGNAHLANHRFIGDRFTLNRSTGGGDTSHGTPVVAVYFDVSSTEVVDEHNHFVDGYAALTDYQEDLYLAWGKARWVVSRMVPKG